MPELTLSQQKLMDGYLSASEELEALKRKPNPGPEDRFRMEELDRRLLSLQRQLESP